MLIKQINGKLNALKYYLRRSKELFILWLRERWIRLHVKSYKFSNSQIFIGSYFADLGGVSHHLQSLHKYSKIRTATLPSSSLLRFIHKYQLLNYFKTCVENITISNRAIHSHVDPWFINISQQLQGKGAKWVHTYHTLYFEKDWDNGLEPWQKEINDALINNAKHADVKIAIAYWLKDYLKTQYQIETVYIPNGVDVTKCDQADKNRFINTYGLEDFILFASGISDIKNAGDFLKLAQALPNKPFVLIGRGISKKALIEKYNIQIGDNLTILGVMAHEDLLDAIAACRVFVVTSRSEGLPTVLMEAMALERSVVGCDKYGTKEVIHSDTYGYIYKHDAIEDLIEKTNLAFITSKGRQARQRILTHYDWKVITPQIDKIYTDLKHE
jgi:glycosyltransferase involved in cell wall biosynthesis